MQALLEEVAGPLAGEESESAFISGMRLVAVDGMCLDLPDTHENGYVVSAIGQISHRRSVCLSTRSAPSTTSAITAFVGDDESTRLRADAEITSEI